MRVDVDQIGQPVDLRPLFGEQRRNLIGFLSQLGDDDRKPGNQVFSSMSVG